MLTKSSKACYCHLGYHHRNAASCEVKSKTNKQKKITVITIQSSLGLKMEWVQAKSFIQKAVIIPCFLPCYSLSPSPWVPYCWLFYWTPAVSAHDTVSFCNLCSVWSDQDTCTNSPASVLLCKRLLRAKGRVSLLKHTSKKRIPITKFKQFHLLQPQLLFNKIFEFIGAATCSFDDFSLCIDKMVFDEI